MEIGEWTCSRLSVRAIAFQRKPLQPHQRGARGCANRSSRTYSMTIGVHRVVVPGLRFTEATRENTA